MFTSYLSLLRAYLAPLRGRVALLVALLFSSAALQLINPQIARWFIDTARDGGPLRALSLAAAGYIAVAVASQAVSLGELYVAGNVGWLATNALRADLVRHCLELDLGFHNARTPGELIERVDGDVSTLGGFFSRFVGLILANGILVAGVLALVAREDWRIGALYAAITAAKVGISVWSRPIGARYSGRQRQASAELFGFLEERLNALPDIHTSGAQAYVLSRAQLALRTLFLRAQSAALIGQGLFAIRFFTDTAGWLLTLVMIAAGFARGELTLGAAYLLIQYRTMVNRPLSQIVRQLQELQQASASIDRVRELVNTSSRIVDSGTAALSAGPLPVTFEHVTFRYAGCGDPHPRPAPDAGTAESAVSAAATAALRDVSFAIPAGRALGVLGRTGSGKTTLSRLLFRLYEADRGTVRLGGTDVRHVSLGSLRRRVGLVTQEVQLFHAAVRDNVTLFDGEIADARVVEVLDSLGLGAWLRTLPAGLDTVLGAGGAGVSSGEAQLLAFARVFLRDPGVVILDEASSRVDPATERLIDRAAARLLGGGWRTAIVIAHRLETAQRTDDILILEDGTVAEYGPRAQLAANPASRFAALLRAGAAASTLEEQAAAAGRATRVPA